LAFLAPGPVPLALLLARKEAGLLPGPEAAARAGPLPGDLAAAGGAITALRRYSLVAPAGDGLVPVHRLVQSITRGRLTAEEASERQRAAGAWRSWQFRSAGNCQQPGRRARCCCRMPEQSLT
jgi:hypothetical protein